jgi:hypothetical protein
MNQHIPGLLVIQPESGLKSRLLALRHPPRAASQSRGTCALKVRPLQPPRLRVAHDERRRRVRLAREREPQHLDAVVHVHRQPSVATLGRVGRPHEDVRVSGVVVSPGVLADRVLAG